MSLGRTVLVASVALLAAAPSAAACNAGRAREVRAAERGPGQRGAFFVGDSTGILAVGPLAGHGISADSRGCRQIGQGMALLRARRAAGRLPHLVIVALGANGAVDAAQLRDVLRLVGRTRVLAVVTPRNSASTQRAMRGLAARYPRRVLLVDWAAYSASHGGWFAGDGLHVSQAGAEAYAAFIARRTRGVYRPPTRALRLPRGPRAGKACGTARVAGRVVRVRVLRGKARMTCDAARRLARRPPLPGIAGWQWFDWRPTRAGPWQDVFVRTDRRVVVATAVRGGA